MRAVSRWMAVLVAVWSLGMHWAALQTVAGVRMTSERAEGLPIGEALNRVLGGTESCRICKWVREGRAGDSRDQVRWEQSMPDLALPLAMTGLAPRLSLIFPMIRSTDLFGPVRSDEPPKPRPRWIRGWA